MKEEEMSQAVEEVETARSAKQKAEIELALKEFGLELKRVRESRNLNQRELHEITRIDRTVLSELERGLYTPSLAMIRVLADALEVSPHIFVAAYYGIPLPEFNLRDKEALDNFVRLAINYMNSNEPIQPYNLTNVTPQQLVERAEADQKAAEESKAKKEKQNPKPTRNIPQLPKETED